MFAAYPKVLDECFTHHKNYEEAEALDEAFDTVGHSIPYLEDKYEKLDMEVGELMQHTKQKCAKDDYGHPWLPALKEAGQAICCWKI